MRASFVDLLRDWVSQKQFAARLQLNMCWCTSEVCKYEKYNLNGGHDDFLLNCSMAAKIILLILHLQHQDFHMHFARKFYEQRRLLSEVEAWNFTKKLLKFVN